MHLSVSWAPSTNWRYLTPASHPILTSRTVPRPVPNRPQTFPTTGGIVCSGSSPGSGPKMAVARWRGRQTDARSRCSRRAPIAPGGTTATPRGPVGGGDPGLVCLRLDEHPHLIVSFPNLPGPKGTKTSSPKLFGDSHVWEVPGVSLLESKAERTEPFGDGRKHLNRADRP